MGGMKVTPGGYWQQQLTGSGGRVGRIRFTMCGTPVISELSRTMQKMLGVEGEEKWQRAVMANPQLLLPDEEEKQIAKCVDDIRKNDEPAWFQGNLLTLSHRLLPVQGVIEKGAQEGEYLALLYDCRCDMENQASALLAHYEKIWKDSCDWMAEFNVKKASCHCLYARGFSVPDLWARLEEQLNLRIERQVAEQDRERVRAFFQNHLREDNTTNDFAEVGFEMLTRGGALKPYRGVLIGLGAGRFFFCGLPKCQTAKKRKSDPADGITEQMLRKNSTDHGHIVEITTFGTFGVNVDGVPVFFRHEKARELLALLVDHRGSYATAQSLITFLWENEAASERTYSRLRKVVMRLKDTLCAYDIGDILESVAGKRRIVPEKVNCDFYRYLNQGHGVRLPIQDSYLAEYSWSEYTHGELVKNAEEDSAIS